MSNRTTKSNELSKTSREALFKNHSDDDIALLVGVHRSTVSRWRTGGAIPITAQRLLQIYCGGALPDSFGEFAGFRVVDGQFLVAPGQHYKNAITAEKVASWFYLAQTLDSASRLEHENARLRADLAEAQKMLQSEFESRLRHVVGTLMTLAYPGVKLEER